MKKTITFLLFTCLTSVLFSQKHEIGFFLGGSNYIGDVGRTTYISPNEFSGGFVYKLNLNYRIALRANVSYIPISGDDSKSNSTHRQQRLELVLNLIFLNIKLIHLPKILRHIY